MIVPALAAQGEVMGGRAAVERGRAFPNRSSAVLERLRTRADAERAGVGVGAADGEVGRISCQPGSGGRGVEVDAANDDD